MADELRGEYEKLDLESLLVIEKQAVLDVPAKSILMEVISRKMSVNGELEDAAPEQLRKLEEKGVLTEEDRHAWLSASVLLTTETAPVDLRIAERIEVISAEVVYGMNVFRDLMASVRDVFGGRSVATQKILRGARKTALAELRREAMLLGADAVVAIDIDYTELSGGQKAGMLMVVATGTAVKLATPASSIRSSSP